MLARRSGAVAGTLLRAWSPYILLVIFVLLWGYGPFKALLDKATIVFAWPGLDGMIQRLPPVVPAAVALCREVHLQRSCRRRARLRCSRCCSRRCVLRVPAGKVIAIIGGTLRDLALSILTIASVLALAYVMNYSGNTATLGLAFARDRRALPVLQRTARMAGRLPDGQRYVGECAVRQRLQVVTANTLGLLARAHGRVELERRGDGQDDQPAEHFRGGRRDGDGGVRMRRSCSGFTLKHSVFLAVIIGLIVTAYAYL